jgi:hypothetical protein
VEGSGHGLIEVIFWHLPEGTEESQEKPQSGYVLLYRVTVMYVPSNSLYVLGPLFDASLSQSNETHLITYCAGIHWDILVLSIHKHNKRPFIAFN